MGRLEFDFDEVLHEVAQLGNNARATLMYRMIGLMGPAMLRTIIRYCCQRLDKLNAGLPPGDRDRWMNYGRHSHQCQRSGGTIPYTEMVDKW